MLAVKKGANKRCCYGVCRSDTRSKSYLQQNYYFISFPKPCLEYRKKMIKSTKNNYIKNCLRCNKCELWVKKCGRADGRFKSINDVTKDTYICSLHFEGESGPTEQNPHPLFPHESINTCDVKKIKSRSSLVVKYKKLEEKQGSNANSKENILFTGEFRLKLSTNVEDYIHQNVQHVVENLIDVKTLNQDIKIEKYSEVAEVTKRSIEIQTEPCSSNQRIQVNLLRNTEV